VDDEESFKIRKTNNIKVCSTWSRENTREMERTVGMKFELLSKVVLSGQLRVCSTNYWGWWNQMSLLVPHVPSPVNRLMLLELTSEVAMPAPIPWQAIETYWTWNASTGGDREAPELISVVAAISKTSFSRLDSGEPEMSWDRGVDVGEWPKKAPRELVRYMSRATGCWRLALNE